MNSSPFQGPSCEMTSDCPQKEGQQCFRYSPYTQDASARGQCRLPCGDDGSCPARGGLPHVCLAGGAGGCYPGNFGLPCARSEECLSQLTCERITADARYAEGTTICTISCHEDINCSTSPWTSRGGFCDGGFCHMAGPNDAPCTRDAQCLSNRCSAIGDASGTCSAVVVGG
jgi:hypothetical protein